MSSVLGISVSVGCSDCWRDLLHLTACILMLVSDMNLSEQCSHCRLVSSVSSSWSLRSRNISRCSLFCSSLPSELDFLSEVALLSAEEAVEAAAAVGTSSASRDGEARSVSRQGRGWTGGVSPLSWFEPLQNPAKEMHIGKLIILAHIWYLEFCVVTVGHALMSFAFNVE